MLLGERIKKVRRSLDFTQQEFGSKIGVKQNTIALIESGKRNTSDQLLLSICREFNVSEEWLRTEEGEMFMPAPDGALEALAREYDLSPGMYALLKRILALKPENQQAAVDFAVKLAEDLNGSSPVPAHPDADIMSELAELKRQNQEIQRQNQEKDKQLQELSARLSAIEEEDELNWPSDTGNLA